MFYFYLRSLLTRVFRYGCFIIVSTGMSATFSGICFIPLLLLFPLLSTSADLKSPDQLTLHNNTTVSSVPPQKDEAGEIGLRSGFDFVIHQLEDIEILIRLENELKSKQTPAEVAVTFAEIEEMKSKIAIQRSKNFPNYIMQTFNVLERELTTLKNDVKKKLLVSLNDGIDNWLEELKQHKALIVDETTQRKAGALKESLGEIKFDLEKLHSITDLERIKNKVEKVMIGLRELKNAQFENLS